MIGSKKGQASSLKGSVLTSWTVHLFPFELQLACIDLAEYLKVRPEGSLGEFETYFTQKRFGLMIRVLWRLAGYFRSLRYLSILGH